MPTDMLPPLLPDSRLPAEQTKKKNVAHTQSRYNFYYGGRSMRRESRTRQKQSRDKRANRYCSLMVGSLSNSSVASNKVTVSVQNQWFEMDGQTEPVPIPQMVDTERNEERENRERVRRTERERGPM